MMNNDLRLILASLTFLAASKPQEVAHYTHFPLDCKKISASRITNELRPKNNFKKPQGFDSLAE